MDDNLSPAAAGDLRQIWRYISNRGGIDAADRLIYALTEAVAMLAQMPYAGRCRDELYPGLRSFAEGQYLILYHTTTAGIRVARVVRGSRDLKALLNLAPPPKPNN